MLLWLLYLANVGADMNAAIVVVIVFVIVVVVIVVVVVAVYVVSGYDVWQRLWLASKIKTFLFQYF